MNITDIMAFAPITEMTMLISCTFYTSSIEKCANKQKNQNKFYVNKVVRFYYQISTGGRLCKHNSVCTYSFDHAIAKFTKKLDVLATCMCAIFSVQILVSSCRPLCGATGQKFI